MAEAALTFEEFAAARLPAVLRFAAVLTGDRGLAEDVVQEVLLRASRRWETIAGLDRPEAYVRKMIVNEYLSWRRRSWRLVPSGAGTRWTAGSRRIPPPGTPSARPCWPSWPGCPPGSGPCSSSATTRGSPTPRSPSARLRRRHSARLRLPGARLLRVEMAGPPSPAQHVIKERS